MESSQKKGPKTWNPREKRDIIFIFTHDTILYKYNREGKFLFFLYFFYKYIPSVLHALVQ